MTKTRTIPIEIPEELYNRLEAQAQVENKTIEQLANEIAIWHVNKIKEKSL